jgi:hypothetical protein
VAEWLAKPPLTSAPILSDLGEILAEADAEMLDEVRAVAALPGYVFTYPVIPKWVR